MQMQRCTGVRYGNASFAPFPHQWCPLRRRRAIPRAFTEIEFDHEINTTGSLLERVLTQPIFNFRVPQNAEHGVGHDEWKTGQAAAPDFPSASGKTRLRFTDA